MARWWFLRILSNSSSFSWILRSISWRTCQAQAGHAEPCSPPAQEQPQPPQGQPGVLPSQPPSDGAACRAHGWIGHHHPAGQASP